MALDGLKKRLSYLDRMGIQLWVSRHRKESFQAGSSQPSVREPMLSRADKIANLGWSALRAEVSACQACELYKSRTNPVFGVGNQTARLLIIGEAPGAHEDKQGEPFVGRGGQLLTNMLLAIGIKREEVYIANILKSRPPSNRDPLPEEVSACTPFLLRQISLIKPRLILAVGRVAAYFLLGSKQQPMASLRGRLFHYGTTNIPLLVTYHPAYLLRAPKEKRKAWQDLQCVKQQLNQSN